MEVIHPLTYAMASNTESQGILSQLYDCIFGDSKSESSSEVLLRILCTGKWREFESRRALLEAILNHPVTILSQEDEGILQAQCAHQIMMENDFVSPTENNDEERTDLYLYLGAGRGSTQFTILDANGDFVDAVNVPTGYPKGGEPNISLLSEKAAEIHSKFGEAISMIVGFDSIFHALKHTAPVVEDESVLSDATPTTGKDFSQLGFLTDLYADTDMLVVRNFITKDGNMRKITFATGDDLLIDLGSGNASLVDPCTGQQIENRELPADWMTNDESLLAVSAAVQELLDASDNYEYGSDEEDTDSECSEDDGGDDGDSDSLPGMMG